jgi:hypothetical protein
VIPQKCILRADSGPLAGQSFVVDRSPFSIGRSADNNLVVPEVPVSRRHACLELQGGRWFLRDLGSSNGTFLNRQMVKEGPQPLQSGDLVGIGDSAFVFTAQAPQLAGARGPAAAPVRSQQRRPGWVVAVAIAVVLVVLVVAAVLLFSGLAGRDREAGSTPGLPSIGLPTGLPSAFPTIQFPTGMPTLQVPTGFPTGLPVPTDGLPIPTGLPSIPLPMP